MPPREEKRKPQKTLLAMAKRLGAGKLRKMIDEGSEKFNSKQMKLFRTLLGVLEGSRPKDKEQEAA